METLCFYTAANNDQTSITMLKKTQICLISHLHPMHLSASRPPPCTCDTPKGLSPPPVALATDLLQVPASGFVS